MANLAERPDQKCPVEKMKDDAFITAFCMQVVPVTRDVFLMRTRIALQTISDLRHGLVVTAFTEAACRMVLQAFDLGLRQTMTPKSRAIVLRHIADTINQQANALEAEDGKVIN